MENKTMDLLNDMAQTVLTEIFGYGQPDGSDYSEYMLKPADSYFEKIETCPEPSLLEELLCWSMYEAVNIHNAECKVFESQQKLEAMIFQQFGTECGNVDNIKYNCTLLDSMHNESKDILDNKVQHFISYCMFADKEFILNGNPYWRQINLAVLEKIYKDSLNFNSSQRWYFPSRFFMMGDGSPRPIEPNFTKGPEYQWNEKENRLEANIYLPMSDESKGIYTDVNPVLANISIEEVCDWTHLDFIIKCKVDNTDCSKLYLDKQPRSARRGVYKLFSLILGNKAEEQENIEILVKNIFDDLFWVWMEDDLPKPETGYMEAKPAIIYCLYRTLPFLTREACDAIFQTNINSNLNDEYLRFMEIKSGGEPLPMYLQLGEHHLHQQEEKFGNHIRASTDEENVAGEKMKDEIFKEKYSIFSMMLYFLFWDIAKNTPTESSVSEDRLTNFFLEHCNSMESFYTPFVDETWNREPLKTIFIVSLFMFQKEILLDTMLMHIQSGIFWNIQVIFSKPFVTQKIFCWSYKSLKKTVQQN